MGRKGNLLGALLFFLLGLLPAGVYSQGVPEGPRWGLQELGFFLGYGRGDLGVRKDLEVIPLGLRLGFDLKRLTRKLGWAPSGLFELVIEPYVGANLKPNNTMEFGLPFFIKYGFPLTERVYPFAELGTGPYYMTCFSSKQSTQLNFISQGGLGLLYFISPHWAANSEFRYRHVSNAAIKKPNGGIESLVFLLGVSYFF